MPLDNATRARLEALVRKAERHVEPPQEAADIQCLLALYDALLAERDKYQALWYETARMVHEERERQAQAAPVLAEWQDHLRRVHRVACDFPFRLGDPDDAWRTAREG